MNNCTAVRMFSENLYELTSENFTLFQSLKILGESKITCKKIRDASEYMASQIEKGTKFSSALTTCPNINFDASYISFIAFAEQTGQIADSLKYLIEKCRRNEENRHMVSEALVYPSIVVCMILCLLIFFSFAENIVPGMIDFRNYVTDEMFKNVLWSFVSILFVSGVVIVFLFVFLNDTKLYEAFLAGGFLVESGVSLSRAIGMSASIAGLENTNGKAFVKAKEGLEYGMDLMTAFCSYANSSFKKEIEMALVVAGKTGKEEKVLLKIAESIKKEYDRKRKLSLSLIEPAFIILTGIFFMQMVINLVMPVITDLGTGF